MAKERIALGVVAEWNTTEARRWTDDPHGELGRVLMRDIGLVVLERAKRLALRRTGKMIGEMRFDVGTDERGVYVDVISPVRSDHGFPYALMHEGRKTRDRRPHRSLIPATESLRSKGL